MQFDLTQRRLLVGIVVATLVTYALVVVALVVGGRPDPRELRAAPILLDGPWRFHPGDDVRWAGTAFDGRCSSSRHSEMDRAPYEIPRR